MITGEIRAKPANAKGHDVFGTLEFGFQSVILPLSKIQVNYAATAAEFSFKIENGTAPREMWFCDQPISVSLKAEISKAAGSETHKETTEGKSGTFSTSPKASGSVSKKMGSKNEAKESVTFKTNLSTVRAVGLSTAPKWIITPVAGQNYISGRLFSENERIMRVTPTGKTKIAVTGQIRAQLSTANLSGAPISKNAELIMLSIWRKELRQKQTTAKFNSLELESA